MAVRMHHWGVCLRGETPVDHDTRLDSSPRVRVALKTYICAMMPVTRVVEYLEMMVGWPPRQLQPHSPQARPVGPSSTVGNLAITKPVYAKDIEGEKLPY